MSTSDSTSFHKIPKHFINNNNYNNNNSDNRKKQQSHHFALAANLLWIFWMDKNVNILVTGWISIDEQQSLILRYRLIYVKCDNDVSHLQMINSLNKLLIKFLSLELKMVYHVVSHDMPPEIATRAVHSISCLMNWCSWPTKLSFHLAQTKYLSRVNKTKVGHSAIFCLHCQLYSLKSFHTRFCFDSSPFHLFQLITPR